MILPAAASISDCGCRRYDKFMSMQDLEDRPPEAVPIVSRASTGIARLRRLIVPALAVTAAILALLVLPPWLRVLIPRWVIRGANIAFLETLLVVLGLALPTFGLGLIASILVLVISRARGRRSVGRSRGPVLAPVRQRARGAVLHGIQHDDHAAEEVPAPRSADSVQRAGKDRSCGREDRIRASSPGVGSGPCTDEPNDLAGRGGRVERTGRALSSLGLRRPARGVAAPEGLPRTRKSASRSSPRAGSAWSRRSTWSTVPTRKPDALSRLRRP